MQLNAARYPSMGATGRTIVAEEGVSALWKGLAPFAVHLFTKYALRFGTNATFQVRGVTTSRSIGSIGRVSADFDPIVRLFAIEGCV